ncbi:MAG TPA: heme-copper oxidase subunit III [Herpetosiphonaceae bacterium]|nr:heme-copper oxidase subunit III [Herpetosiphonaceae bacterium]
MMEKNRMGMLLFLASEAMFFSVLILAYVYYRGPGVEGPTAETALDPVTTGIFTIFLLASSVTFWLAERSIARQRELRARLWLLATVHLGVIFLIGQGWEYFNLFRENVTIDRNLFGTTFFTLTGFHGFHVFGGLVAIAILTGLSATGHFRGPHSVAVETVGLYWHFVDVVWIIIFALIYVWPFL